MNAKELLSLYAEQPLVQKWISKIQDTPSGVALGLDGVPGSFLSVLTATSYLSSQTPILLILTDKEEAAYVLNDLEKLVGDKDVLFYPGSYRRPYEVDGTNNANILLRAEVLNRISNRRKSPLIVSYADAIFEQVITKKELRANTLQVKTGDKLNIDFLNETLFEYHFERVDFVTDPGQFSIRGGIADVFSFAHDHPVRIEFFGNEVDSIRTFDVETQLSIDPIKKMEIVPNVDNKKVLETRQSFLEYVPENTTVWVKDASTTGQILDKLYDKAEEIYATLSSDINHYKPYQLFTNSQTFGENLKSFKVVEFGSKQYPTQERFSFSGQPQPSFNKNFELLTDTLNANTKRGWTNYILCGSQQQIERFHSIFEDIGAEVKFTPVLGALHEGWEDTERQMSFYTDHQIFERYQRFRLKNGFEKKQSITLKELNSLQYGDYVTHIDHGIGKFGGLQKIDVNGKTQEAIKLIYRDSDTLYISIHSLHKISKYNSKDGTAPAVHKLGSPVWNNLKNKTKKKVKEIAYDLIRLYAKRKEAKGFSFSPDSYLQHELEASFVYEDTPDQYKATQDVKMDMEKTIPMDRLVCGDVGFGKTEVAIRAAFKAATDGKQVAVLVPTTILAFQHHKTFSERLKDFPVRIDYLNRFKSAAKTKATLADLADGKIDIIIGTHKLVGKDVKFKDLGLLIIDEEQKFGVAVKDKLKTLRVNVDTLTLTATPIPRTLQFSLMAARDLSVINTPPPNRQPIETELIGFNEEAIRDAIMYEVSRGGQVFFIHNRIQNIREVAGTLQRLCPDVRFGIGHGQMDGKKLEDMMLSFMEGEFDVLISTTIIESGLDVPNANTIIINHAQNFGLSDLHQMRGRVGRGNKKAFCKLITPPLGTLPDESRKRLQAIEQFSDLGSGFKIALRDLEIRGAGDMLGAEQSGFITDMGMDAYQKILAEAVEELKETEFKDLYQDELKSGKYVKECQLDTDLEILIPDEYVNNIEERLRLYRELDSLESAEELDQFREGLIDRFGELPQPVEDLINSMHLRWIGQNLGFEKIVIKMGKFIGYFTSKKDSEYFDSPLFQGMLNFVATQHKRAQMKQKNDRLSLVISNVKDINEAMSFLQPLALQEEVSS
ncbi:transcription-repair coupling factor [Phaeocystidibacter marisrubri]|uniref:Transcription-repair-coupling factor n=1 Tax=Phaeocystidibacter marisrubri TaxID=1577780 RepID=A0A6L3ZHG8_9FLAO|nr:transcription-repair coupling factor [Phaeocystidibacter marisrubri]GGH76931.1 transcription-repair-coupling factor [Phaeocystidibacter marisrubri]